MGLFDFSINKAVQENKLVQELNNGIQNGFPKPQLEDKLDSFRFRAMEGLEFKLKYDYTIPYQSELKSSFGFYFGNDNLYPNDICKLYNTSPLHQAILNFKADFSFGAGITENFKDDYTDKIKYDQMIYLINQIYYQIGLDYYVHNCAAIKVYWNEDFTKIIKLDRVPTEKIRIFEVDDTMKPTQYIYCWDWAKQSLFNKITFPIFDIKNKKDKVQLLVIDGGGIGKIMYSLPTYVSNLNWVSLDADMANYHSANINNSINPSMLIEFPNKPNTTKEMSDIRDMIMSSFSGTRNTGRPIIFFNADPEKPAKITQVQPNQLDKTFLNLTDTIQRQICYAHKIDPAIMGLKTPGSLGNSNTLDIACLLFAESLKGTIKKIEDVFNNLLNINGLKSTISFNESNIINILTNSVSKNN